MAARKKPWAGRFEQDTAKSVEKFTCSLHYDSRLYRYDIEGSIAHATMLADSKIISRKEAAAIVHGLKSILFDMEKGGFIFDTADEDIHMAIEKELIRRIGETGGKLHTARSRNDQIALDVRLFLRAEIHAISGLLAALQKQLVKMAGSEIKTIMPGYTHMQKAQPVLLSHYLMAFAEMFVRDEQRFADCGKRLNVLPLGSAALAGTGLPIDRGRTAKLLNFPVVSANSMDTVADRDYIAEFIFAASLTMMHLSRFCEDLVFWSSDEFGFAEISDAYTTGSSIMPQKKNPDIAELIRGKTARVYGDLISILTLLKGLPMTYNRDLQEDKEPLFDAVDTVRDCLAIFTEMLAHTKFHSKRMREAAGGGFSTATDVAEYLVQKGVPFRQAHEIVGGIVAHCLKNKKTFADLALKDYRKFHAGFQEDIMDRIKLENSVNARRHRGGTATSAVKERIRAFEKRFGKK
ncbi:MAG: Argininosuccinate lyase 1 [Deltaproteobacteria bacterium ADurb.Bin151]|jgi:argininosuccinate lyase|nr:argininosuccinate lyase [Smithella sp.]OQB56491.1 MAG: Argininosuccinate lyase 1 [Deltaproteobacteria bacterium ADurb.Bin151]HOG81716.1 argininosuccinate lyase [Smithellaceae bacterium]HOQ40857.1 argininosuccinate lyase [Smithellaceae bacterium]HPL65366.1 argininosuccinate lyase [Smithellaceae bacterium]